VVVASRGVAALGKSVHTQPSWIFFLGYMLEFDAANITFAWRHRVRIQERAR
jgi:hypothetical protein